MPETLTSVVRDDWVHLLTNAIQRLIGTVECDRHTPIEVSTVREFLAHVSDPVTPIEDAFLGGMLLRVAVWLAATAHDRVHDGKIGPCGFRLEVDVQYPVGAGQRRRNAKTAFERWLVRYFRALRRAHPVAVEYAAAWIRAHSREPLSDGIIARQTGAHVVVLRRNFKAAFGVSLRHYRQQVRLADTIRLLATGSHDVRSALYIAGWASPKSLYRAAIDITGMPLRELRALSGADLERRLALPASRLTPRRSSPPARCLGPALLDRSA